MAERTPLYDLAAQAGAVFKEEAGWLMPAHYGDVLAEYQQAREKAVYFDVSQRGKIELTGPDARSFLHNLCTNDIKKLTPGTGCEAFLLTAKAKVVAQILVYVSPLLADSLWLDIGPGLSGQVIQHLNRFVISEQVELIDRTAEFAQLYVVGPKANAILDQVRPDHVPRGPGKFRVQDLLGIEGFHIVCQPSEVASLWTKLTAAGARPAGLDTYDLLRVEAGTPTHGVDFDEDRFVVEIGRGKQAICYTKGCYLGQEPVVMARDRGHVNRSLVGVCIGGVGVVANGAKLFRDGTEVGQITSSVVSPRLGAIALAYVRRGNQEPGTALEVESDGNRRSAVVSALPFSGGTGGSEGSSS